MNKNIDFSNKHKHAEKFVTKIKYKYVYYM